MWFVLNVTKSCSGLQGVMVTTQAFSTTSVEDNAAIEHFYFKTRVADQGGSSPTFFFILGGGSLEF